MTPLLDTFNNYFYKNLKRLSEFVNNLFREIKNKPSRKRLYADDSKGNVIRNAVRLILLTTLVFYIKIEIQYMGITQKPCRNNIKNCPINIIKNNFHLIKTN